MTTFTQRDSVQAKEPTILVVDDTEDNLDLLEFALKRKPIKMLRASSGKECLAVAQEHNPDVILLDIQMPEMDGFETLKRLRANRLTAKIPVVFLTAQKKDPGSIEAGLEMGAEQYLTKPIDTEELIVRTRTLIRMKQMEAELERTKADFMAMLVHDLRSPIMGIKSVIEYFKEDTSITGLKKEHMELLDSSYDSAVRMLELINDLLDFSKYEAGNVSLEKSPSSLPSIVDKVCRQMDLQFRQKNITIKREVAGEVPSAWLDGRKIEQVVMNLLSNSLKFTPNGGTVRISIAAGQEVTQDGSPPRQVVRLTIADTGVGISTAEIPLLFDRYKQLSSSRKTKQKGTGLGLAICKLIVEAHEGSIAVTSELDKGTSLTITLPIAVVSQQKGITHE
ncbi:MAG TPA: hybrid sensor histidine kinase/response regulator [Bacteroidota bacterium]|nr:hybrid sensor histidine kinase/response regulator [Bacteroidota bacterium]